MPLSAQIEQYRERPIPNLDSEREVKAKYPQHPLDRQHVLFNEEVLDALESNLPGENYYYRRDNPPYYRRFPGAIRQIYLRRTIIRRLQVIQARLADVDLKLWLNDGLRPLGVQKSGFAWACEYVKGEHPHWTDAEVEEGARQFWAQPESGENPNAPEKPHFTGAALDYYFKRKNGEGLYVEVIQDELSEQAYPDYFEGRKLTSLSAIEARSNRRLTYWTWRDCGFTVHPFELLHVSDGDRLSACIKSHQEGRLIKAHYGAMPIPKVKQASPRVT